MRRPIVASFVLAILFPIAAVAADGPKPLIGGNLLGTYTCAGKAVSGRPVTGKIGWTYADGTALMFFARLEPSGMNTFIDETWSLESPDTGYIAQPNPNSKDKAMYRSGGWKNGKLDWQRMAAGSMLYREIALVPGGVRFAVNEAGGNPMKAGYTVRCKRRRRP
jgi:hypothetical protein